MKSGILKGKKGLSCLGQSENCVPRFPFWTVNLAFEKGVPSFWHVFAPFGGTRMNIRMYVLLCSCEPHIYIFFGAFVLLPCCVRVVVRQDGIIGERACAFFFADPPLAISGICFGGCQHGRYLTRAQLVFVIFFSLRKTYVPPLHATHALVRILFFAGENSLPRNEFIGQYVWTRRNPKMVVMPQRPN